MIHNSKILIVDDSRVFAEFLYTIINTRGYLGIVADSGKAALNALKESAFNLILLDLELPDIHGNEVLKMIRANPEYNDTAVIIISGTNDPDKIIKSLELGANDFISKPFNETMLGLKIKNLLTLQISNQLLRDEIKEHKETTLQLSSAKNDIETIFNYSPAAMILVDKKIKIKKANIAALNFFKKSPDNESGLDPGEFLDCIHVTLEHNKCGKSEMCKFCSLRSTLNEVLETKTPIENRQLEIKIPANTEVIVLTIIVSTVIIHYEGLDHILLCIDDISERIAFEKAIKKSEKKYKSLFNSLPIGVTITDKTGLVLESNKISEQIFGLKSKDQEYKNYNDFEFTLIKPDLTPMPKEELARVRAIATNSVVENVEMGILKPDNNIIWLNVSATPFEIDTFGIILTFSDITARFKMEAELKELLATKEKLFSIIAHDLRNPFNILLGMSDLLIKKLEQNDLVKVKSYAQHLYKTSEQTYNLLENLLSWSRSQTGKLEPKPCFFKIKDMVSEIARLLETNLSEKKLTLTEHVPDDIIVYADSNMVKTAIRNLITNAIKFSFENSIITVSARNVEKMVELSISDTGVGIPADNIPNLFNISTNKSSAGTMDEKGSGLGLVICKEFIELNGGKIWVDSHPNSGSIFYFTLQRNDKESNVV